ncbi:hypothetical protein EYF80_022218 [Liparis tanakae]|uniref:Uncharacterized protein n=1 Tax=Liparis tanakae TaxID=230148 RepID=A0A4Z2HQI0_9TELE|nr:hypothetical protein EYF80_022218 [Liparis tanakae]
MDIYLNLKAFDDVSHSLEVKGGVVRSERGERLREVPRGIRRVPGGTGVQHGRPVVGDDFQERCKFRVVDARACLHDNLEGKTRTLKYDAADIGMCRGGVRAELVSEIINLMVPAAGHEDDFPRLLDDFKRLTGFFRVREKTPVSNLSRRHIVREVAVSVAQELLLTGRIQEPLLPATDVC